MKTGKLKALAVTSSQRLPIIPDVPTVGESVVPQFNMSSWYGIMAPAKTPPAILAKLQTTLQKVMDSPETQKRWSELGAVPIVETREQFEKALHSDIERWSTIVKSANVRLD
ncbi:Bug family tripartite tricarboxylate transporter substrate binding protein [Diaphorobacter aerolatus]|uniref:Bug family tripartite tricarboxylate transporter substrate binding protein n=1 Tax=Diaphorobacter aerolatus TaxID=1288495 RepID=UPI0021F7064A|nr:tripartite tricarboxylate transporter substrate-binding protein [Diaphorobacter aerolatus]